MNTRRFTIAAFLLGAVGALGQAQVLSEQKISATSGGFTGRLLSSTQFGRSMASLGDFDGDGVGDVAVGSLLGGPLGKGSVWLLFLNCDGTVKAEIEVTGFNSGVHQGGLTTSAGAAVASLGDHDGDGVCDLIVGSPGSDLVGVDAGAAWIVFLNRDGTSKAQVLITEGWSGFTGDLGGGDEFGRDVGFLGDVDGNGIGDVVVGAPQSNGTGAVFVCFLNRDGTVRSHVKISDSLGGFTGVLDGGDAFGHGCAGIGDLDGDEIPDLAVGARSDDDVDDFAGAVWILFLRANGQVRSHSKIVPARGLFGNDPIKPDAFGADVVDLGDLDGDSVAEIGVSTFSDDDGGSNRGSFWIVHLRADGTVRTVRKISQTQGGFGGQLRNADAFGLGLARIEDLQGDGTPEIAVGALGTDDGASTAGALWILFMDGRGLQASAEYRNAGTNPESYRSWGNYAGTPVHGGTLELSLDVESSGHRFGTIVGYLGVATTDLGNGQYLLVDTDHPSGEILHFPIMGAPVVYTLVVPETLALCGLTVSTQGLHLVPSPGLTRRHAPDLAGLPGDPLDLVYSNAIDFQVCR